MATFEGMPSPDSAPLMPVEAMSASNRTCSSVSSFGDFGHVGLRARHEQVRGLCAVDGVAETPAAEGLAVVAVTALRGVSGQAGIALIARRDCILISGSAAGFPSLG
jgi:hypothetical protein